MKRFGILPVALCALLIVAPAPVGSTAPFLVTPVTAAIVTPSAPDADLYYCPAGPSWCGPLTSAKDCENCCLSAWSICFDGCDGDSDEAACNRRCDRCYNTCVSDCHEVAW